MPRIVVKEAEAVLDREFRVLDKGFVRLVDYLGGDSRIVAAARVSYGPGTRTVRDDRRLIHYLMRNLHTSPFEQVVMTFHVRLPIFVARQWIRHRTARVNEISGRYSILSDDFYLPDPKQIAAQSRSNRQGRSSTTLPSRIGREARERFRQEQEQVYANYQWLLHQDVARELARINLPLSTYTEWYWQIDLHNLFHFLQLRLDSHAQAEIREYADRLAHLVRLVAPVAVEAFEEYVLNSRTLSGRKTEMLRDILRPLAATSTAAAEILDDLQ